MPSEAWTSLTDQQRAFLIRYVETGNPRAAWKAAGYTGDPRQASGLLRLPWAREALQEAVGEAGITKGHLLAMLGGMIQEQDIADYQPLMEGMKVDALRELGVDTRHISELTVDRRVVGKGKAAYEVEKVRLKLTDRLGAVDRLAKILALYTEKHEHSGSLDIHAQADDELAGRLLGLATRTTTRAAGECAVPPAESAESPVEDEA